MALEDRLYPLLKLYESSPDWLRVFIGSSYRRLPQELRLGKSFSTFQQLANECHQWSAEKIKQFQFEELRTQIEAAWSGCVAYQAKFSKAGLQPSDFRTIEDLKRFPFTEKSEIQENLPAFVNSTFPKKESLYITTGGSTGVPVGFYLQRGISRPKEQAFLEAMWMRAGYYPGARVAVIRGHVTSSLHEGKIHSYDATRGWLMLSSYHLVPKRMDEYLKRITDFAPEFLHAYPSAALQIAEYLQQGKIRWPTPLKAVLCGSERLTDSQKRLLEDVFKCKVYRWYGHAERAVLAGEGVNTDSFYFWPTYGFVEFGEPDEEGLQEIIGTSFHNRVMPLIRYRTGDKVSLHSLPHASKDSDWFDASECWHPAKEFRGREQEFLISDQGRKVSLTAFNMHDRIFDGLYSVQFYQRQAGHAEFRYVSSPAFATSNLNVIMQAIQRKLGDDFKIELRKVEKIEKTARGKHQWLITDIK